MGRETSRWGILAWRSDRPSRRTSWLVDRVAELRDRHDVAEKVVLDVSGPAGSLVAEFDEAGIQVDQVTARGHAQACGLLFDLVTAEGDRAGGFWHLGQNNLAFAVKHAVAKPYGPGGAWLWQPTSDLDITPADAVTLALGAAVGLAEQRTVPTFAF